MELKAKIFWTKISLRASDRAWAWHLSRCTAAAADWKDARPRRAPHHRWPNCHIKPLFRRRHCSISPPNAAHPQCCGRSSDTFHHSVICSSCGRSYKTGRKYRMEALVTINWLQSVRSLRWPVTLHPDSILSVSSYQQLRVGLQFYRKCEIYSKARRLPWSRIGYGYLYRNAGL